MIIVSSNSRIIRNHRKKKLCKLRIHDRNVVVSAMSWNWKIICISVCLFSVISIGFCTGTGTHCGVPPKCQQHGNNQINQNLNQNTFGLSGFGGSAGGFGGGAGGIVWLPQNGINIANANGGNNQINQNLNQNAFGG